MKRFIFTESQWCRLNEGRARKPQINMDVELPKQGRVAVKITPKEFEEKMHAIWDKHIENTYGKFTPSNFVYRFCRQHLDFEEMKAVRDDLAKIQHNEENLDAIGKIESSNGLTYLKCDVGGDWEAPMLFFLYWDGNKFRAYIPTYGNAFNRSTKTAFGNNDEEDLKFLKSQNPDFSDEELSKFIHNVGYNVDACLKDFKARVTVKKSNVNENIGDVKKIHLTEGQYNFLLESVLLLEMSLSDIYAKYYSDIPQEEFNKIVFADPTSRPENNKMGKYGKWLLSLYQRGKLKIGDLGEAKECLSTFSKYISRIEVKDINKYGSIRELYDAVRPFMSGDEATSKSDALRRQKHAEAEKVYEDELWEVIIPHTQKASCIYGKGTKWCTAAENSQNMFDYYNERGPLYININKKNGKKYQFHFETESFMDAEDEPIDRPLADKIGMTDGLVDFYSSIKPIYRIVLSCTYLGGEYCGWMTVADSGRNWNYVNDDCEFMLDGSIRLDRTEDFYMDLGRIRKRGDGLWNFVTPQGRILYKEWFQKLDYPSKRDNSGWMAAIDENSNACMVNWHGEIKHLDRRISAVSSDLVKVYGNEMRTAMLKDSWNRTFVTIDGDIINPELNFERFSYESAVVESAFGRGHAVFIYGKNSSEVNILKSDFTCAVPQWAYYITSPPSIVSRGYSFVFHAELGQNVYMYETESFISPKLWFKNIEFYDDDSISQEPSLSQAARSIGKGEPWLVGEDAQGVTYLIYDDYNIVPVPSQQTNQTEGVRPRSSLLGEQMLTEASLGDIYAKYYSDIPQDTFAQIIAADPTSKPNKMGKYGKWLLSLYQRGKLKVGDLNEAKACLEYFAKFINRIEVKDINKYGSIRELYDVVEPFMENPNQTTSKSDALRREKEQDAAKVYEDDMWEVIVPHTQEMACLYGKHTRWCTAAESSQNMFDYYHRQGELYININKQSGKKYQFHFESDSFMDETDNPINSPIAETIRMTDGLLGYYKNNRSFTDYLRLLYNQVGDESEGFVKVFDENEGYSWVRLSDGKKLATAYYYEDVGDFHSGRAWVYVPHNEREAYGDEIEGEYDNYNFVNERGVLISDVWYEDVDDYHGKYTRVARDWKYNLIDLNGKPLFGWGQYIIHPTAVIGMWSIRDPQRGVNFVNGDGQIVSPNMWFDEHDNGLGSDRNSYIWGIKYKYDDNNERYEEQYKVYPNGKIEKRVVEGRPSKRFHMTEEQYHKLILLSKENGMENI